MKFFPPHNNPAEPLNLREMFPWEVFRLVAAALLFVAVGLVYAYAGDGAVVPSTEASIVASILSTVMPVIILVVSTLGPVAGGYIVTQIIGLLGITSQTKKLDVENKLREVLHLCSVNALKFAFTKAGLPLDSPLSPSVISDALFYVKDKNPGTVAALGLDDTDLMHIIQTKVGEVASSVPMKLATLESFSDTPLGRKLAEGLQPTPPAAIDDHLASAGPSTATAPA